MKAVKPINERARLAKLKSYDILDSLPETLFDGIVQLAASICEKPICAISLIDSDRQWFKSITGLDATETPRDIAFCAHAILNPSDLLEVPDATADPRFSDNPLVTDAPSIRFYAGAPLVTSDNFALGTLCVIDEKPGELRPDQLQSLKTLADLVVSQIELRKKIAEIEAERAARCESEARLVESEWSLSAAIAGAELGVWDWNVQTGEVSFSERWTGMLGYGAGEIEPHVSSWEKLVHPADLPEVMTILAAHLEGNSAQYRTEYRIRHKHGHWLWILAAGRVMRRAPDGTALRAVGIHKDITQRKLNEIRLRESEARLADAQRLAGLGSWDYDIDTGDINWSPETFHITGRDPKLGPPSFDENLALYTPASAQMIAEAASLAVREGTRYEFDLELAPGREVTHVHAVGNAMTDAHGRVTKLCGTIMDISKRKQLEHQLAEREQFLKKLSNTILDVVMVYDLDEACYVFRNHDLFEMLGHDPAHEMARDPYKELVHPSDVPHVEANWDRVKDLKDGDSVQIECRFRDRFGNWRHYQTRISAFLRHSDGTVKQLLGLARDISQNRELENQVAEQMIQANRANHQLHAKTQELFHANSALEVANVQLEALATSDGLTGLKNHRTFQEFLEQEYQRARRYNTPLSLLLLDVDHFKKFNDTFGHQAGDEALKQVARILSDIGRAGDLVARYGGEEFVLVLPNTPSGEAMVVAERVRAAIEASQWQHREVTVSLGVSSYSTNTLDRAALITGADQALYASKANGRNRATHAATLIAAA